MHFFVRHGASGSFLINCRREIGGSVLTKGSCWDSGVGSLGCVEPVVGFSCLAEAFVHVLDSLSREMHSSHDSLVVPKPEVLCCFDYVEPRRPTGSGGQTTRVPGDRQWSVPIGPEKYYSLYSRLIVSLDAQMPVAGREELVAFVTAWIVLMSENRGEQNKNEIIFFTISLHIFRTVRAYMGWGASPSPLPPFRVRTSFVNPNKS